MRRPNEAHKSVFNEQVGRAVRDMRIGAALTIAKLADAIGMSTAMLTNVEHGATALPLFAARNIAEVVDCTLDDLVPVTIDEAEED